MRIKLNAFYSCYDNSVFVCFEKLPTLAEKVREYNIFRDDILIASGTGIEDSLIRPWEFDNDHHTELFKPDTRNWLCYKDNSFNKHTRYTYRVETVDKRHSSINVEVLTT